MVRQKGIAPRERKISRTPLFSVGGSRVIQAAKPALQGFPSIHRCSLTERGRP